MICFISVKKALEWHYDNRSFKFNKILFSAHVLGVQMVRWLDIGASTSQAHYIICIYLGNFALWYVVFVDVCCTSFSLNDLYLVCCLCTYIFVWFKVYWTDLLVLLLLFGYRAYASCWGRHCVFCNKNLSNLSNLSSRLFAACILRLDFGALLP